MPKQAKARRPRTPAMKPERGEYRAIYVVLIDSPEYLALSEEARACLWPLKLKLGKTGIEVFHPETLLKYTGMASGRVRDGISDLVQNDWLRVEEPVYWLRNGLRYDPLRLLDHPHQRTSIERHLHSLPKLVIVNEFAKYYTLPEPFPDLNPSTTHRDAIPMPLVREPIAITEDGRRKTDNGKRNTDDVTRSSTLPVNPSIAVAASAPAAATTNDVENFVSQVIRLANRGMSDSGIEFKPILASHGSRQNVFDWIDAGVSHDVIETVVYSKAKEAGKQVSSMGYFDNAVAEGWERHQAGKTAVPQKPAPNSEHAGVYASGRAVEQPKSNQNRSSDMQPLTLRARDTEIDWDKAIPEWLQSHPIEADELHEKIFNEFAELGVKSESWIRLQGETRLRELVRERILHES